MKQLSEKFLNMTILKGLTDDTVALCDSKDKLQDGTIFYTSFGIIIGGLYKEEISSKLSEIFLEEKKKAIDKFGSDSFRNDGEIICVKNASIIQNNGKVIYNDCLFLHVDSILGFSLCNLEEAQAELMNL